MQIEYVTPARESTRSFATAGLPNENSKAISDILSEDGSISVPE